MSTAVESLYREHAPALFRYLVRMTADAETAEDVLHDTFARLMTKPPRTEVHLRGWLFRVATNRLRDLQRRSTRHLRAIAGSADRIQGDAAPAPDRAIIEREAREQAQAVLDTLNERDRAILLMREEGFTHREIAEVVGTTTQSVGTLIARALDRVRRSSTVVEAAS